MQVKALIDRLYKAADKHDKLGNHTLAHELRGRHVREVQSAVAALESAERAARVARDV